VSVSVSLSLSGCENRQAGGRAKRVAEILREKEMKANIERETRERGKI
jgi:hypothetical protein